MNGEQNLHLSSIDYVALAFALSQISRILFMVDLATI